MKKLVFVMLIMLMSNFLLPTNSFSERITVNLSEVDSVLNDYFNYLMSGDTAGILNLLTGPFLEKRERLLRYNPEYPDFLRNKYQYAQFSIIGHQLIDAEELAVDVQIIFNDQDIQKTRFILVQKKGLLKIYTEEEIPKP